MSDSMIEHPYRGVYSSGVYSLRYQISTMTQYTMYPRVTLLYDRHMDVYSRLHILWCMLTYGLYLSTSTSTGCILLFFLIHIYRIA